MFGIEDIGYRYVIVVPSVPLARFVATEEQERAVRRGSNANRMRMFVATGRSSFYFGDAWTILIPP